MSHPTPARLAMALAWALSALGSVVFGFIHALGAIGILASGGGHEGGHGHAGGLAQLADPASAATWVNALHYGLAVVPALLVLVSPRRAASIGALVLGGLLALAGVGDGIGHAILDGTLSSTIVALLAIAFPATVAVVGTIRGLRRPSAVPADTVAAAE